MQISMGEPRKEGVRVEVVAICCCAVWEECIGVVGK